MWETLADVGAHGDYVPLTRVTTDPLPVRPGWGFSAWTGLGPLGFRDTMVMVVWQPPGDDRSAGRFRIVKTGRLLAGWADVRLTPGPYGGTHVAWRELVTVRGLGPLRRLVEPVEGWVAQQLYACVVDAMLEVAAKPPAQPAVPAGPA